MDINDQRTVLNQILTSNNPSQSLSEEVDTLTEIIPELTPSIGFSHRHPHHHLDVWEHTLAVVRNLDSQDLELNMAGFLHDIGKPYSYQDEEVRHFHGHPEKSYEITLKVLQRLGYDPSFIDRVSYLVRTHDTIIDVDHFDNSPDMIDKRLRLQYADARAHHPDKVAKRIDFLDALSKKIDEKRKTTLER